MATSPNFIDVNEAALARGLSLLESLLPGGRLLGREYVCGDLTGGSGNSLKVNTDSGKWCDFATGDKGGDFVSLYAAVHEMKQGEALRALAEKLGLSGGSSRDIARLRAHATAKLKTEPERPEWVAVMPVPDDAPDPLFPQSQHGKPSAVWQYLNSAGKVLGYTVRFDFPDGEKAVKPFTYCRSAAGKTEWRFQGFPEPRPLYGLNKLANANADSYVLLVEGEKTADAASRLYGSDAICMTWPGGSNAVGKVDLSPLANRHVVISPDADAPGFKAALGLTDLLKVVGAASVTIIVPPADVKQGWDLADAEAEGWDTDRLGEWMQGSMVTSEQFETIAYERFGIEAKPSAKMEVKPAQENATHEVIDAQLERIETESDAGPTEGKNTGAELEVTGSKPKAAQAKSKEIASQDANTPQYVAALRAIAAVGRENILHTLGSFWLWRDFGVWCAVDDLEIKQIVQRLEAKSMHLTGDFVGGVLALMKNDLYLPGHKFDQDQNAINCLNGELHWIGSEWELRPHQRESFRTTQIPVEYDPAAQASRFEQFLEQVFRDDPDREDKIVLVCEVIGYSLLSTCEFEKFILAIGPGANGKSVLMDTVASLVGSANTVAVQPSQFENRFQRAHLHGKLVNMVTEIAEGAEIADAQLKSIVSGEPTTAEHKHKPPFEFSPICTCWFGTNHMPHTRDFSNALFRRAIILTFNRTFGEKEQDKKLKGKLRVEMPGILNLVLEAMAGVYERGCFTTSTSSEAAKNEWRMEADQVAQFAEECCVKSPEFEETSAAMYHAYMAWAEAAGIRRTVTKKTLTNRMCKLGAETKRGTGGTRLLSGFRISITAMRESGTSGTCDAYSHISVDDRFSGNGAWAGMP